MNTFYLNSMLWMHIFDVEIFMFEGIMIQYGKKIPYHPSEISSPFFRFYLHWCVANITNRIQNWGCLPFIFALTLILKSKIFMTIETFLSIIQEEIPFYANGRLNMAGKNSWFLSYITKNILLKQRSLIFCISCCTNFAFEWILLCVNCMIRFFEWLMNICHT